VKSLLVSVCGDEEMAARHPRLLFHLFSIKKAKILFSEIMKDF
jgi:hypothetical protein